MQRYFIIVLLLIVASAQAERLFAYNDLGHHVVTLMAFDLLPPQEQQAFERILHAHPRFADDFISPVGIATDARAVLRWQVGQAGYWPDVVRPLEDRTRPNWHFQLGATAVLGDESAVKVPDPPGPLPEDATMESRDLYIAQALTLCRRVLADTTLPDSERAVALCWVAHLVGDAHQPCHAGSLYAAGVFPEGDRGANLIPIDGLEHSRNLHALWDNILGPLRSPSDVERLLASLRSDPALMLAGETASMHRDAGDPEAWLAESRLAGRRYVYTDETLLPVTTAMRGLDDRIAPITLSESYLQRTRRVTRLRIVQAAHRLARVYLADLGGN